MPEVFFRRHGDAMMIYTSSMTKIYFLTVPDHFARTKTLFTDTETVRNIDEEIQSNSYRKFTKTLHCKNHSKTIYNCLICPSYRSDSEIHFLAKQLFEYQ